MAVVARDATQLMREIRALLAKAKPKRPDVHLSVPVPDVITLPFADYASFDECVAQNQDKDSPEAFCGWLKHKVEGSGPVNLPDIADVKFPAMIGAIPSKPKRRKPVRYKGVTLARRPLKFEAKLLSLTDIPPRLDAAVAGLRHAHGYADTMRDMAVFGVEQALLEFIRQGATSVQRHREELSDQVRDLATDATSRLLTDRAREWATVRARGVALLASRRLGEGRRETLLDTFLAHWEPSVTKRYANRAVNEAFALGRSIAQQAFCRPGAYHLISQKQYKKLEEGDIWVDAVVHTAVMDTGTCDACAEVDGEVMDFGSARQEELRPPYVNCLGSIYSPEAPRCRCVQIALLSDGTEIDVDEVPDEADGADGADDVD